MKNEQKILHEKLTADKVYELESEFHILDPFLTLNFVAGNSQVSMSQRLRKRADFDLSKLDQSIAPTSRCNFSENGVSNLDIKYDRLLVSESMVGGYCISMYNTSLSDGAIKADRRVWLTNKTGDDLSCSHVQLLIDKNRGMPV